MPDLTRRPDPHRADCWLIYFGDVHVGTVEHLKFFATTDAGEAWFEENDPEGVAFEYEVLVRQVLGSF